MTRTDSPELAVQRGRRIPESPGRGTASSAGSHSTGVEQLGLFGPAPPGAVLRTYRAADGRLSFRPLGAGGTEP